MPFDFIYYIGSEFFFFFLVKVGSEVLPPTVL